MKKALSLFLLAMIAGTLFAAPAKSKSKSKAKPAPPPPPKELQATLAVNPKEFGPLSTIQLTFPTPMIAKERVGSPEAEAPLQVTPPLKGRFEWTSTRSGLFRLDEAPKFSSGYTFSLKTGIKDLEGKAVGAGKLMDVTTEKFRIVEQYPHYFSEDNLQRMPRLMFEFNDSVTAEAVAPGIFFVCGETKEKIGAKARLATGKDFKGHEAEPQLTWAEQIENKAVKLTDESIRDSAVVIEPLQPLNPGKEWALETATSIVNKIGSSRLDAGDKIELGTVVAFEVTGITPHSPFDTARHIDIDFSRDLVLEDLSPADRKKAIEEKVAAIVPHLKIEPAVADLKHQITEDETLVVSGSFELGKEYHVTLVPEVLSADGLKLVEAADTIVQFQPNPPYVAASTFIHEQMASGAGEFEFVSANVTQVRMRAKRLTGPQLLQAIQDYKPYLKVERDNKEERSKFKPKAFDEFPGSVVFDRTFPFNKSLDQSSLTKLTWKEILGDQSAAPLFIELEGLAMPSVEGKASIAQTLVEFTDIGLFHKTDYQTSTVMAVSLATGKPQAGIRLSLVDENQRLLGHATTDATGLASLNAQNVAYVLAESGTDCTALPTTDGSAFVPLWHFNVNTAWRSPWKEHRKTFLFADRPLYKPGETAHLKCYTRVQTGDTLKLDSAPAKALLQVRDPRYKIVIEKPITFTANGSWNDDLLLPSAPTGWYQVAIKFPKGDDDYGSGSLQLRVDDYRPNAFEVKHDLDKLTFAPDRIKLPLKASYYMGKPLSKAKVVWNAYRQPLEEVPEPYTQFHFGDAPAWAGYGKDSDGRDEHIAAAEDWSASGEGTVDDEGTLLIEMPTPPALAASTPQRIRVESEVTDINEQTISNGVEFALPGPAFMLGLKAKDYFVTAGKPTTVEAVAITQEGEAYSTDVPVKIKLERQAYHSIKVQTAGGGETVKNQITLEEELNTTGTLHAAAAGTPASLTIPITPKVGGKYFLTVEASDPGGKPLLSRLPVFVLGGGEFPWAVEDGASIDLQPDKTELKPGDTATIVVKTPIAGHALVTVERNKIQRHFQTDISPDNPVIKVPVTEEDAPNIFVSVLLIRGAKDSPQAVKMPEYKIGYCSLNVESHTHDLAIEVEPEKPEVKPGEQTVINAVVNDGAGKPVANAEVTLAAVDEGVLSLMAYETPAPETFFHEDAALAVSNHTNLGSILTEDAKARMHGNKGFVVGGGGDENEPQIETRKNFIATPLWTAVAMTDASGKIKASFTAPDNLTRYRLMAVASEGATRFGSAEGEVVINKPLMVEPALPRFARTDDELMVKAIVHNTTPQNGEVEVQLTIDDRAEFITEDRLFVLASLNPAGSKPEGKVWKKKVTVKGRETTAVSFPVKFSKTGEAKWNWQAKTLQWSDATALSDRTESTFNVEHPVPEQREVHYYNLAGKTAPENLLKDVRPEVLEGDGTVSVTVSSSALTEVGDALDYVLHYPYGCVEQTSSSMMPWLALGGFQDLFPGQLDPAKRKEALQRGVNRLLSMVTEGGGLSYWPGGKEPQLSGTAYGGYVLLKARDAGISVPDSVISELLDFLSKSLRHVDDERDTTTLTDNAFALYTLAKGGKPEPAYENMLYLRRAKLPPVGKLYLALAKCLSNAPEAEIKTLLTESAKEPSGSTWSHWSGSKVNNAFRLLVCAHLGMTTEAKDTVSTLLGQRNARGEWGNTFTNGWTLTALAGFERSQKPGPFAPLTLQSEWGDQKGTIELAKAGVVSRTGYVLNPEIIKQPLKLTLPEDRQVYARVETKSWSKLREFGGANQGYGITRSYEKLLPDGNTDGIDSLRVGDMVIVRITVEIGGGDRYLAINDPLPAVFEAVNPEFETENVRQNAADKGVEAWFCDFRELRTDRALFFTDYCPGKGKFELTYLARVVAEGDVVAPSATIEAMYQPDKKGLSATQRIKTLPNVIGKDVAGK